MQWLLKSTWYWVKFAGISSHTKGKAQKIFFQWFCVKKKKKSFFLSGSDYIQGSPATVLILFHNTFRSLFLPERPGSHSKFSKYRLLFSVSGLCLLELKTWCHWFLCYQRQTCAKWLPIQYFILKIWPVVLAKQEKRPHILWLLVTAEGLDTTIEQVLSIPLSFENLVLEVLSIFQSSSRNCMKINF